MEFERKKQWGWARTRAWIGFNKEQGQGPWGSWGPWKGQEFEAEGNLENTVKYGLVWLCKKEVSSAPVMTTRNSEWKIANSWNFTAFFGSSLAMFLPLFYFPAKLGFFCFFFMLTHVTWNHKGTISNNYELNRQLFLLKMFISEKILLKNIKPLGIELQGTSMRYSFHLAKIKAGNKMMSFYKQSIKNLKKLF